MKIGDRIRVIHLKGEDSRYDGKTGQITHIDSKGQLHGTWGGLAVIPEEDEFETDSSEKRNWSTHEIFNDKDHRSAYKLTREEWIELCLKWSEDRHDLPAQRKYLSSLSDENLIEFIADMHNLGIRETTWLEVGNSCLYQDTGDIYTIKEIRLKDGRLTDDSVLVLTGRSGLDVEAFFCECYGLAGQDCPNCGNPLLVSDTHMFKHVCLCCETNFP